MDFEKEGKKQVQLYLDSIGTNIYIYIYSLYSYFYFDQRSRWRESQMRGRGSLSINSNSGRNNQLKLIKKEMNCVIGPRKVHFFSLLNILIHHFTLPPLCYFSHLSSRHSPQHSSYLPIYSLLPKIMWTNVNFLITIMFRLNQNLCSFIF